MPLRQVAVVLGGLDRGDRAASHQELERFWQELRSRLDANQSIVALAHHLTDQQEAPVTVSAYEEWKTQFCERRDAEAFVSFPAVPGPARTPPPWGQPLVVWRAFAGTEGEPLDLRVRWFGEAVDGKRLHSELAKSLRGLGRSSNHLPPTLSGHDRGAVVVQVLFDDAWRPRPSHGPWAAPEEVPRLPPGALVTLALAQLTGEPPEDFTPTATYVVEVGADAEVVYRLEVFDPSLTAAQVRGDFAAKLSRAINVDKLGPAVRALVVERGHDGLISWGRAGQCRSSSQPSLSQPWERPNSSLPPCGISRPEPAHPKAEGSSASPAC